jgi:GTPase SAR1 family protein
VGQDRFRTLTKSYYRNSDGIIVVYDITNRVRQFAVMLGLKTSLHLVRAQASFEHVRAWLTEAGTATADTTAALLIGNKSDLSSSKRQVSTTEGSTLAKELRMEFTETSAKTGTGVSEAFELLASVMLRQRLKKMPHTSTRKTPKRVELSAKRMGHTCCF